MLHAVWSCEVPFELHQKRSRLKTNQTITSAQQTDTKARCTVKMLCEKKKGSSLHAECNGIGSTMHTPSLPSTRASKRLHPTKIHRWKGNESRNHLRALQKRKKRVTCTNTPLMTWAASSGIRLAGTAICLYAALAEATAADNESMNWERSWLQEGVSRNRRMNFSELRHKENN